MMLLTTRSSGAGPRGGRGSSRSRNDRRTTFAFTGAGKSLAPRASPRTAPARPSCSGRRRHPCRPTAASEQLRGVAPAGEQLRHLHARSDIEEAAAAPRVSCPRPACDRSRCDRVRSRSSPVRPRAAAGEGTAVGTAGGEQEGDPQVTLLAHGPCCSAGGCARASPSSRRRNRGTVSR